MGFFKKYPIFCVLIAVFLLLLGGGIYLVLSQGKALEEAKRSYRNAQSDIERVSRGITYDEESRILIAPTPENKELLRNRLDVIQGDIEEIRRTMSAKTEGILLDPAGEFTFLPKLQAFIADMKVLAAEDEVTLNENEAFGFARYAIRAEQPAADMIPALDRQQQVLEYILRQLFAAEPSAILSVERELIEAKVDEESRSRSRRNERSGEDVFIIEELITARSNEFIDTFAFRLVFTGTTEVLRNFLNRIAGFELPLIVRSIDVVPVEEGDEPEAASDDAGAGDTLASLFGAMEPEQEEPEVDDGKEPIITENKSKFSVVIEFVELRMGTVEAEEPPAEVQEDAA